MTTYGWIGKILTVDLTDGRIGQLDTAKYAPEFLGGRGVAARIAWDEIKPGIDAYSPENMLIFMTGPLTGTSAPTSGGRIEICGVGAQTYPTTHYTRSSMGGYWGAELKYAGYDGIVLRGKAEFPVYLWIHDGEAGIMDAREVWGLDTFDTQVALKKKHGKEVKVVCIGPAGERLVRLAIIHSELESAAGQGGFGAVMGSKQVKAVAVAGSGEVRVADPKGFLETCRYVQRLAKWLKRPKERDPKIKACTMSCPVDGCGQRVYKDVQGVLYPRKYNGAVHCVSCPMILFVPWEAGFEMAQLANRYGVNHWDLMLGLCPPKGNWLGNMMEAGYLKDEDISIAIEPPEKLESGVFWSKMIRKMTYKEGIGEILSEGIARATDILGKGKEFSPHLAHGFMHHWSGPAYSGPVFPYWLVSALQWATDSRDPNCHGYAQEITWWWGDGEGPISMDKLKKIGKKVYGSEKATDIESGYEYKAQPTIWNQNTSCVQDSLLTCDNLFPLMFSQDSEDGYGDTGADAKLFMTATGVELDERGLRQVGERIFNLERAIMVREGRSRRDDEYVKLYYRRFDRHDLTLDERKFDRLLDEYYTLRGWDVKTGIPTRGKLEELGLSFAAEELQKINALL